MPIGRRLTNLPHSNCENALTARKIAVVVLEHSQWPMVKLVAETIVAAVDAAKPGSYVEVDVPFKE